MSTSNITYSVEFCLTPKQRKHHQIWKLWYTLLSEEEVQQVAIVLRFDKNRVLKLINHKNKKYCYIWKKDIEIIKHFHDEPVETLTSNDPRQPVNQI